MIRAIGFLLAALTVAVPGVACAELKCGDLKDIQLRHAGVTAASTESIGAAGKACKFAVVSHPTRDSDIRIEVWIPAGDAWNGKFVQLGNGGFAGRIDSPALKAIAARGYAVAATDDGHSAALPTDATWALGHPEKIIDFGWRALKETTDVARLLIEAQKGMAARRAYFFGCSDGGREALMEAQRFPQDFDGIVAGAPANDFTGLLATAAWTQQAQLGAPGAWLTPSALKVLQGAALSACGGGAWVADPASCGFDPAITLCKPGQDSGQCLSAAQVAAARAIYGGPHDSKGRSVAPGFTPGGEAQPGGWGAWITGPAEERASNALAWQFAANFFRYMGFDDPKYDILKLSFDAEFAAARAKTRHALDAVNPDLSAFRARGGKLIQYHGWNDAAIAPRGSIAYYEDVRRAMGDPSGFYRLFMVPGMLHCGGGPGPSNVDWLSALEDWVEHDLAPAQLIATNAPSGGGPLPAKPMSQRLCAYPLTAQRAPDATSSRCVAPRAPSAPLKPPPPPRPRR